MRNPVESLSVKKRNIAIWDEIAPRYHRRWAAKDSGPFKSTGRMLQLLGVGENQDILDVACGTGIVTKSLSRAVGRNGSVVGVDSSFTALKVAKKWCASKKNIAFIQSDAEFMSFSKKFDTVTCQYALFFFPNAQRVLKNIKKSLKKGGIIGISVHGKKEEVPFFNSIIGVVQKHIPDYTPRGAPDLDRFSTKSSLRAEAKKAGFSSITVEGHIFSYSPGKFEDYWRGYLKYIAKPLKEKLESLPAKQRREIRKEVKQNTQPFTKADGTIVFPWKVLIMKAVK